MNEKNDTQLEISNFDGLMEHCKVASLILTNMEVNPHTKHHIRSAIREASLKITKNKGSNKDKAEQMSTEAFTQMQRGNITGLILEHVIPVSYINALVLDHSDHSAENICKIVCEWTILSIITKNENDTLSNLGFAKKMPSDWDEKNKYARYEKAGIKLILSRYKELKNS